MLKYKSVTFYVLSRALGDDKNLLFMTVQLIIQYLSVTKEDFFKIWKMSKCDIHSLMEELIVRVLSFQKTELLHTRSIFLLQETLFLGA